MTVQIIRGNALNLPLADDSVDLVVTSPPYFGLRSYQDGGEHYDGQIGAEATPAEFVDALIAATREMVRVVKPSGSIWVNLGDKYAGADVQPAQSSSTTLGGGKHAGVSNLGNQRRVNTSSIRAKSLIGIPWRYALRCIDDLGLILRAEVIWSKPNGLPESVTDRVRRSHEQWFHFTLNPRYYSAVDEVREAHSEHFRKYAPTGMGGTSTARDDSRNDSTGLSAPMDVNPLGKLPSSVWEIDNEGESLVRCVLSAIHTGALTIDEGERILKGQTWTGEHASGARSTSPATAGSGRQAARPRDTASSGSTAGQSSRTESPSNSTTDPSPMDSNSTTSAASGTASGTLSPSPSATTCSEGQAPSQRRTPSRLTAETGTSSPTPTPTGRQTAAASAANASAQRTADATGRPAQPQPDAPGSVWSIPTEPLRVPESLGIDHFAAFPTEWPRRIITGWSPRGVCVECGAGRRPVRDGAWHFTKPSHEVGQRSLRQAVAAGVTAEVVANQYGLKFKAGANHSDGSTNVNDNVKRIATDFRITRLAAEAAVTHAKRGMGGEACDCPEPTAPTTPGVVLDPFGGTGTTALVADALGRHGISVDMSRDYCRLAEWRTTDPKQRAKAARKPFTPAAEQVDGQASLLELIEETA